MSAQDETTRADSDFAILTEVTKKLSLDEEYLNPMGHGPHYNNTGMEIIGCEAGNALANIFEK